MRAPPGDGAQHTARLPTDPGLAEAVLPLLPMGFNPFREQKRTTADVLLVVVFVAVTAALVAWGFFG